MYVWFVPRVNWGYRTNFKIMIILFYFIFGQLMQPQTMILGGILKTAS